MNSPPCDESPQSQSHRGERSTPGSHHRELTRVEGQPPVLIERQSKRENCDVAAKEESFLDLRNRHRKEAVGKAKEKKEKEREEREKKGSDIADRETQRRTRRIEFRFKGSRAF